MDLNLYAVIIAGGSGTRFWPVSRRAHPKQFLALIGQRSLLQQTVARIAPLIGLERILIVTGAKYLQEIIVKQLPELDREQILVEPISRNTAVAASLASLWLARQDPKAICLILPADHIITDEALFLTTLARAAKAANEENVLVTLGLTPCFASTGFGYIETDMIVDVTFPQLSTVASFHEKPDYTTAQAYLKSGRYLWNSGIFVWRAEVLLSELARHQPVIFTKLNQLPLKLNTASLEEALRGIYPSLPIISIDRGILEKTKNLRVVKADFGWSDLGSWEAVANLWATDEAGNASQQGQIISIDAQNNLISAGHRLVAILGVNNLVAVVTEDVFLILSRQRCQDLPNILKLLESKGLYNFL